MTNLASPNNSQQGINQDCVQRDRLRKLDVLRLNVWKDITRLFDLMHHTFLLEFSQKTLRIRTADSRVHLELGADRFSKVIN